MKRIIGVFILCCGASCYGQGVILDLGRPFGYYRNQEIKKGSTRIDNKTKYQLNAKLEQPVTFVRTWDDFEPSPVVRYFFLKSDSSVQSIGYEWDRGNFRDGRQVEGTEGADRLAVFKKKYSDLAQDVERRLGKGVETVSPQTNEKDYLEVRYIQRWEKDTMDVVLLMVFSNRNETNGAISFSPTHRIRLDINRTTLEQRAQEESFSTFEPDSAQQRIAQQFISQLLDAKYEKAWEMMNPEIRRQVSFDQFRVVADELAKLKRANGNIMKLVFAGPKVSELGIWNAYNFTFDIDNQSGPPETLIEVVFHDKGTWVDGFSPKSLTK